MNKLNTYKEQLEKAIKLIDSIELYQKLVEVGEDHVRTMNGLGLEARDSIHSLDINQKVLNRLEKRFFDNNVELIRTTVNHDTENRDRLVPSPKKSTTI